MYYEWWANDSREQTAKIPKHKHVTLILLLILACSLAKDNFMYCFSKTSGILVNLIPPLNVRKPCTFCRIWWRPWARSIHFIEVMILKDVTPNRLVDRHRFRGLLPPFKKSMAGSLETLIPIYHAASHPQADWILALRIPSKSLPLYTYESPFVTRTHIYKYIYIYIHTI